jgi:hypothetical protein
MCTVSFLPLPEGYALLMNRDEQRTRAQGLPPTLEDREGRRILSPSEPGGGTWVAVNDAGTSWALINWYSIPKRPRSHPMSRGAVVRGVAASLGPAKTESLLESFPLDQMNPFRLIGIFPADRQVHEWRWNNDAMVAISHPWRVGHWISSGFDEPQAERVRGTTFRDHPVADGDNPLEWLRGMHRSHLPQSGPFSICMHRDDAVTVSHSEIRVTRSEATMTYQDGPPCEGGERWTISCDLAVASGSN